jgi:ABC-type Fe3+-hydroxamate transport system substrate-binding protein
MRICSHLPGATEVVAALGLADDLVGISHECDYPAAVKGKPVCIRPAMDFSRAGSAEIDERELARVTSLPGWGSLQAVCDDRVFPVDAAAYFSRPGPRLVDGVELLAALLHPELFAPVDPDRAQRVAFLSQKIP